MIGTRVDEKGLLIFLLCIELAGQQELSLSELNFWTLTVHINSQLDLKYNIHFARR